MPELKDVTEGITRGARDAAYVVVGLGVLGIQRAQVRRQEIKRALSGPRDTLEKGLGEVRGGVSKQVKAVDEAVEQVIRKVEDSFEPIEERLPEQARNVVRQARSRTREARQQLRNIVTNAA